MKDWKKFGKRFLSPPIWVMFLLTVVSAISLAAVFVKELDGHPVSCIVYAASFYTFSVVTVFCVKILLKQYKSVKQKIYENKYGNRYMTDVAFKTHISLYLSLAINLLYVATNAIAAIMNHTNWFGIYAIYYAIMALMRFLLVRYVGKNGINKKHMEELKCTRLCAYILMTVNLALSGAVLMMVNSDRGFEYQGYMIYVMAMYTFWVTTFAVTDLVKYRKYSSPVMSTSKVIKLASSMMSMLALETAMFAQFGADSPTEMKNTMIMATGGGIAVIVVVLSVYIIVRSTNKIRKMKKESENE